MQLNGKRMRIKSEIEKQKSTKDSWIVWKNDRAN